MSRRTRSSLLVLAVLVGCAAVTPQTYVIELGFVDLPEPTVGVVPEALPVEKTRLVSLDPALEWNDLDAPPPIRTLAVTIVPSGPSPYTVKMIYYPPTLPERVYDRRLGYGPPRPWVVADGMEAGPWTRWGPATFPCWFDEGDPVGTWRAEVFVDGEKQLDEAFEIVRP